MASDVTELGWEVTRLGRAMGARVEGPDLTQDLSEREAASLQALLAENLVLVLPDQKIDEQQHVRFSTHFGDLYLHPFLEAP